ncbi:hypothetical protein AC1031_012142 [Aphanomyces cochlioides]|nr:hypothetical protein AC1031_012142 [Aphanomyces cochlioides]
MSFPALKLTYFDVPARAEVTRLALTIGGVPFEDHRIDRAEWPTLKPTMPYKQLPILTVNGQVFAQSHAIDRYAGILAGLYPIHNPLDALRVDEICDFGEEIVLLVMSSVGEQDHAKRRAIREEQARTKFPAMFAMLEARLDMMKGPWLLDSISVADLSLYCLASNIKTGFWLYLPTDLLDQYSRINAIHDAVAKHPKVAEWNKEHNQAH